MVISSWFIVHGSLTGPAGPGIVPRCGLREMSVFLRLGAVYVSLLANIGVLYQILSMISSRFEKNLRDTALDAGYSLVRSELK